MVFVLCCGRGSEGVDTSKLSADVLNEHLSSKDFNDLFAAMRSHLLNHNPEVFAE